MNRTKVWRTVGFLTVYALAFTAVTAAFWRSPQPSADDTTRSLVTSTSTSSSRTSHVDPLLAQAITLSSNTAYGIAGSASFVNQSTVVLKGFSIIGRGPKTQVELRDSADETVAVLRDISQLTLSKEDLVLAVPTDVDSDTVTSLVIVAPDYNLVLSRARWK